MSNAVTIGVARVEPTARERVDTGFTKLDEIVPGWTEKIDRPVNVHSAVDCPCGQVFGGFAEGLEALGIGVTIYAWEYGFMDEDALDNRLLNAEWERRIEIRRAEEAHEVALLLSTEAIEQYREALRELDNARVELGIS